jgi:hypothetical protein
MMEGCVYSLFKDDDVHTAPYGGFTSEWVNAACVTVLLLPQRYSGEEHLVM